MNFMMHGALTVDTLDRANNEMADEAGRDNLFLFGLGVEKIQNSHPWYNPHRYYEHKPATRAALDRIFSDYFSRNQTSVVGSLRDALLTNGDRYMHLADLTSYCQAQDRVGKFCAKSRRMDAQSHSECGQFGGLKRPYYVRICNRNLEGGTHAP